MGLLLPKDFLQTTGRGALKMLVLEERGASSDLLFICLAAIVYSNVHSSDGL